MDEIRRSVVSTLNRHGCSRVEVDMQLSPAWTTDWISQQGKQRMPRIRRSPFQVIFVARFATALMLRLSVSMDPQLARHCISVKPV